jgi:hypothetical protein
MPGQYSCMTKRVILFTLLCCTTAGAQREEGIENSFLDSERFQELGQRDAVCLGSLANSLAAGDGAADAAHAELEECLGCLGLGLEEIIDGAVCGYFSHSKLG